jgi:hypothetical protein
MQLLLLLFCVCTFFCTNAQINRSTKELATENINNYLSRKIFKKQSFQVLATGNLQSYQLNSPDIVWTMESKLEAVELKRSYQNDSLMLVHQPYKFLFYLDKRLKVVVAERTQTGSE